MKQTIFINVLTENRVSMG